MYQRFFNYLFQATQVYKDQKKEAEDLKIDTKDCESNNLEELNKNITKINKNIESCVEKKLGFFKKNFKKIQKSSENLQKSLRQLKTDANDCSERPLIARALYCLFQVRKVLCKLIIIRQKKIMNQK